MVLALYSWQMTVWLLLAVILFFILAVANRQGNNFGMPFHFLFSMGGVLLYLIIGYLWSVKYGLMIGLVAGFILGVFGGQTFGGDE